MLSTSQLTFILKRSMLRAAKLPLIYLVIGLTLIALAYIDDFFPLTSWKNLFDLTDKLGSIFIALAILTFVYKLIVLICRRSEKKLMEKHSIAALILTSLRKGLRIIFILVVINVIITLIEPTKIYLEMANNILNVAIIASIGWIAIRLLYTVEAVLYQNTIRTRSKNHRRAIAFYTKAHIIRNIATVIIIVITMAAILMSFSSVRNIGISLLASAGFLTAIVGLAAQKPLFTLFSGLQIAMAQTIKIGDIVVVEKESGIIEEITFTYVTLKLGDRRRLIVPISYFIENSFENWSHEQDSLRSSILFYVDYMMPIEPMRTKLNSILKSSKLWDGKASKLQVANLTKQAVEIRIQVSAGNADRLSDLRAEVREKMLEFLREQYPHCLPLLRLDENKVTPHETGTG